MKTESYLISRRSLVVGMTTAASSVISQSVFAQSFPSKPVELVVLFPAGSSADITARALSEQMAKRLGQQILVVNKPGGGGSIGYRYAQQKPADGYTLVFNSTSISTGFHSGLLPFDYRAFDAIARVTVENPVIAVKANARWQDLKSMMVDAKKRPGLLSVGNSGIGSHTHISSVAFFNEQKADVMHVPFGASQVVPSLLGGQIDAVVSVPSALTAHVRANTLRIVGVLAEKREPAFPNVPTSSELGMAFNGEMWRGIASPKGTPKAVVTRIEKALQESIDSPEFKAQGEKMGFIPAFMPSIEFGQLIAKDDVMLAHLMTQTGLKLN
ncbi:tripartite tricarboxylate transporter substrate binding protein [Limnohabitans sp.]|uniref:Bug family tripartite tricarboxylate transporter substrate binding protein n=1 Tax=Limnohabitans sp. TaxID=1907725 RepID=UPI002AFFB646|nr:tripartite tricarboxylate transporter substrate binding protein [Limnohabitans sp.]